MDEPVDEANVFAIPDFWKSSPWLSDPFTASHDKNSLFQLDLRGKCPSPAHVLCPDSTDLILQISQSRNYGLAIPIPHRLLVARRGFSQLRPALKLSRSIVSRFKNM